MNKKSQVCCTCGTPWPCKRAVFPNGSDWVLPAPGAKYIDGYGEENCEDGSCGEPKCAICFPGYDSERDGYWTETILEIHRPKYNKQK